LWSLCGLLAVVVPAAPLAAQQKPPETRQEPVTDVIHGVEIVDAYRWLEDQQSPETRAWIDAQSQYTRSILDHLPGRETLRARIAELVQVDQIHAPTMRGNRYFFMRRTAGQDVAVIYMREGHAGRDVAIIDPQAMQFEGEVSVTLMAVSGGGTLIAFAVRRGGDDQTTIRFYDVDQRRLLDDALPPGYYFGITVTSDDRGCYYSRFIPTMGSRIRYHEFGADPALDREIFATDVGVFASGRLSSDGRRLLITAGRGALGVGGNELYVMDPRADSQPLPITTGFLARFFAHFTDSDHLVLRTDYEAPRYRVMLVDLATPTMEHWTEIVPEGEAVIQAIVPAGGKVLVVRLVNVVPRVSVYEIDGTHVRDLEQRIGSIYDASWDWDSDEVFSGFYSYNVPPTIYRYSVARDSQEVWAGSEHSFESDLYQVQQVWYQSKDGTSVPMFIMHRKGIELDGTNPTYLTGYGGFGANDMPGFSALAAAWAELGGVYAVPNLRGGGEFGEAWHEAGMLANKQNVFDDFIAAAEWLIANGYTSPAKLAIGGSSNGGLLVGAAMTQRPDLFRAVYCSVPLLDMIRYHQFLVAPIYVPELGSSDDPDQFSYLLKYSPYHNVKAGTEYPAVMFETGDSDTRIAPLHARKMTALMQTATASGRPVVLRYDTGRGHVADLFTTKTIDDLTARLSFLLWQLGEPLGAANQ
jgi:prolyl oligopeptidase